MTIKDWFKRVTKEVRIYRVPRSRYARGTEISETEASTAITSWQEGDLDAMFAIFNKMRTGDPHINATADTSILSVVNSSFTFTTDNPEKDEKQIQFLNQHLRPRIPIFAGQLAQAFLTGVMIAEIKWNLDGPWIIEKLIEAPPAAFTWKEKTQEFVRVTEEGFESKTEELDPLKTLVFTPQLIDGLPYGILQSCINWFMFKDFAGNNWASHTEIHGMPFRLGKYKPGATQPEIDHLWEAVYSMGNDSAAVISDNSMIELLEDKSGRKGADIYKDLIEIADMQISKAILGQTSTTETIEKGNYYTAKNHADVQRDRWISKLRLIEGWINTNIITPLIQLNLGIDDSTKIPRLVYNTETILDALRLAQTAKIFYEMGSPIHPEDKKRAGLTVGDDEEPLVKSEGFKDLL